MPEIARLEELQESPDLLDVMVVHAYRGVRVQLALRVVLLVFMATTIAFEPPVHDLPASVILVVAYGIWTLAVMLWTRGGGLTPIRWMWVVLLVDVFVIGSVTLIAGASAKESWTADILVNGLFLVPMLAATQLRPRVCVAVVGPAVAVFLVASLVTQGANGEPLASVLLSTFVLAGLGAGSVGLSGVQRSRVLTIAGLARDRADLLTELLGLEQRERTRLAEQLHDGALQYVLAARQDLGELRSDDHELLARVDHAVTTTATLLRTTVAQLHPAVLHQAGLVAALRQLAAETHERLGIEIDLDVRRAELGSSSSIDDLLFGAARELLANVGKHAQATRAGLGLSAQAGTVSLVVSDDGVGFDSERLDEQLASGHVGLASLRARVAGAGGRLDITRGDPSGTVVTITLPEPTGADRSPSDRPDRPVDGREVSR